MMAVTLIALCSTTAYVPSAPLLRVQSAPRARPPSAALESAALVLPEATSALEAAGAVAGEFGRKLIGLSMAAPVLAWPIVLFGGEGVRKSSLIQSGKKMKTVKLEAPKIRGVRLSPDAVAITNSFRKEYAAKDLELLWGALIKVYGSSADALAAAQTNPQVLNPSYSFCNSKCIAQWTPNAPVAHPPESLSAQR